MHTPFIVCEVGGNHQGNPEWAKALVEAAKDAGADAVKFQCFTPEQMADDGKMITQGPWAGMQAVDLYRKIWTPRPWFLRLFERARSIGLVPFSSVFHKDDVDFLETIDCPIYKIASFELTDLDLIAYAASTGKPLIISTGMGTEQDIEAARHTAEQAGCTMANLTLLKCTSAYPAPIAEANLRMIRWMAKTLGCDIGLSDHTKGATAAIVATALGAKVIEKHMTLDRRRGGPDAAFSAEPDEFRDMVNACRDAAQALGQIQYGPTKSEAASLPLRRKPSGKRGELNGV